MENSELTEDWVEEEIKAALLEVSVDGEESAPDDQPPSPSQQVSPDEDVSQLFRGYLSSLHTQHSNTEHLLTQSQELVIPGSSGTTADTQGHTDEIPDVQGALNEFEEEWLLRETQLAREHEEREALLNARITESEQLRANQTRIIEEREAAKKERENACVVLQKYARGYLARLKRSCLVRKRNDQLIQTVLLLQRYIRGCLVRREVRVQRAAAKRELAAAIAIQRLWRGHSSREKLAKTRKERSKGQSAVENNDDCIPSNGDRSGNHGNNEANKTGNHGNNETDETGNHGNITAGKLTISKRVESALKLVHHREQLSCQSMDRFHSNDNSGRVVGKATRSSSLPLPCDDVPTLPSPRQQCDNDTPRGSSAGVVSLLASKMSTSKRKATLLSELHTASVVMATSSTASTVNKDNQLEKHPNDDTTSRNNYQGPPDGNEGPSDRNEDPPHNNEESLDQFTEEEKALNELEERRAREEMIAQSSRERMSMMMSNEELAQVAKQKRDHSTYRHELEHASSPMLANAWLGIIKERLEVWQSAHRKWVEPRIPTGSNLRSRSTVTSRPTEVSVLRSKSFSPSKATPTKLLSAAQLCAASPQGTSLDEVTQVILYRARPPMDLTSFSKCPNLRSLSLHNCGVVTMETLEGCDQLMEISMQSNMIEHVDCNKLGQLRFADFSNNRIASIHGYESCSDLLELNLSDNRLARVSGPGVRRLARLQALSLDANLLINCKGVEQLGLLQRLSCSENHLPRVEGLERLSLLQHLQLSQNNLQQVPSVCDHVLLRELHLDENSLSSVGPITEAWLPLLQTLSLANNCIVQLDVLASLLSLETLNLQNNTIYDLPVLLQAIRGCFKLKCLRIHGNPVTEEPKFRMYLCKALPHLITMDDSPLKRAKLKRELPASITASPIVQLCCRQIREQDDLKEAQQRELEELAEVKPSPGNTVKILETKVSHCHDYQRLLIRHLREHEMLTFGRTEQTSRYAERKAAILIQSYWKGLRVRQWYERLRRRRHQAATVIQANYRGYLLRRRLQAILDNAHLSDSDDMPEVDVNYDEEIPDNYLNESLDLLQPLSPSNDELKRFTEQELTNQEASTERTTPLYIPAYTLPGAVDDVITLEEWTAQSQPSADTISMAPGGDNFHSKPVKFHSHSNESHSHVIESPSDSIEEEVSPPQRVGVAWALPEHTGQADITREDQSMTIGRHGNIEDTQLKRVENEWGLESSRTAELLRRRTQREKKRKKNALKRKKLADPMVRLAVFKKQGQSTPLLAGREQHTASSYPQAHSTPDLFEEKHTNQDFLYQWVHHQRVVHNDGSHGNHSRVEQQTRSHSKSSLLPHIEPHVLAGHAPRLVSADAQNQLVQSNPKERNSKRQ